MVTLASLGIPEPKHFYKYSGERRDTIDGGVKALGAPQAVWHWDFCRQAWRDALKVYCPGSYAIVYIETRVHDNSDSYDVFTARMIWPEEEEKDAFRRMDFDIEFRHLVAV